MNKQIIKLKELEKITFQNHILNDNDYKYYELFLKKFYCKEFLIIIIDSITNELKEQIKQIPNTEIKVNLELNEEEFELEILVEKFNNKELLIEQLEELLITERLLLNSIYEKLLNIKFIIHFEEYIKLLQQVFYDIKNDIINQYEKLDKDKLDEILYKILVSLFEYNSIKIEKAIKNENKNV